MQSVTLSRTIDAPPEAVDDAMADLKPFMLAAGFDEVAVDDEDRFRIAMAFSFARIELVLDLLEDDDAALAYEQHEGIFEEMVTAYELEETAEGTDATARTEFALDVAVVGGVLDATVIKRQRRRELDAQLEWLAAECETGES